MQFVNGESFKDSIDRFHADADLRSDPGRRSLELRKLLHRFTDVCNAIEYAHSRGVLHRDIKPANVIVGTHGETLVVDWGLAKAIGRTEVEAVSLVGGKLLAPTSGNSAETLPGSNLGTPAYMSPEQAVGDLDRLGPRSDIYSLGATLYALLTGKPPFASESGGIGEVLRKVQAGIFPKPRAIDPSLDPALEAVCLKAMSARPEDRYASPRTLAEDVEKWAADEPVSCYEEPARRRVARWERRHKTLVNGAVAALAVTAVGLGVVGWVVSREKAATDEARAQAEQNAKVATGHFLTAVESVNRLINEVADQKFNRVPGFEKERREMPSLASYQFNRFVEIRPDDTTLLRTAQRVHRNLGVALWTAGDVGGARKAYELALAADQKIAKLEPGSGDVLDLSRQLAANRDFGAFLFETGYDAEAKRHFEKARRLVAEIDPAEPEPYPRPGPLNEARRAAGWFCSRHGEFLREHGTADEARASLDQVIGRLSPVADNPREWYWYRLFIALAHRNLAGIALEEKDTARAAREFDDVIRRVRAVAKENHDNSTRETLARTLLTHAEGPAADLPRGPGADADADADVEVAEAVSLLEGVVREFPGITWYRRDLAWALRVRGDRHASKGRENLADADFLEARRLLTALVELSPEGRAFPGHLGRVETSLGRLRLRQKRGDEARALFKSALARLEKSCKDRGERAARDAAIAALREAEAPSPAG